MAVASVMSGSVVRASARAADPQPCRVSTTTVGRTFVGDVDARAPVVDGDGGGHAARAVADRVGEQDVEHLADRAERRQRRAPPPVRRPRRGDPRGASIGSMSSTCWRTRSARSKRLTLPARPVRASASSSSMIESRRALCSSAASASSRTSGSSLPASSSMRSWRPVSAVRSWWLACSEKLRSARRQLLDALGAAVERRRDRVDLGHAAAGRREREVAVAEPGGRAGQAVERIGEAPGSG